MLTSRDDLSVVGLFTISLDVCDSFYAPNRESRFFDHGFFTAPACHLPSRHLKCTKRVGRAPPREPSPVRRWGFGGATGGAWPRPPWPRRSPWCSSWRWRGRERGSSVKQLVAGNGRGLAVGRRLRYVCHIISTGHYLCD